MRVTVVIGYFPEFLWKQKQHMQQLFFFLAQFSLLFIGFQNMFSHVRTPTVFFQNLTQIVCQIHHLFSVKQIFIIYEPDPLCCTKHIMLVTIPVTKPPGSPLVFSLLQHPDRFFRLCDIMRILFPE